MPSQAAPPATVSKKFSFFYGHRKPSQNRRTVRGGLFTNRQTLNPNQNHQYPITSFDLQKWSPEESVTTPPPRLPSPSQHFFAVAQSLSPIARYIIDSFRKHKHWGPQLVADLNKLRRVTPKLVAEVLKVQSDPIMSSKFFHWAGKQKGHRHDFASYNAFAYCLNRNNQFRAADQVPELMNMQVISGMCQYGTIEEARKVFSSMRECKMLTESDLVVFDDLLIDHMKKKTADLVLSGLEFFRLESKLKAKGSNLLPN